jgi:serine/threonine protein kinase
MMLHDLPEASVLQYRGATELGSGTFGVVIAALPSHARGEGARADRVAVKLMPLMERSDDVRERMREIVAINALKESGDIGNVVVAKRFFLHRGCKRELEQFSRDGDRSVVARAQFISRALSTLRIPQWQDLIAIEMDIAQGSVRCFLKLWGQNFAATPARFAYTPDNIADQWLLDSSNGVRALHACKIAHRDMKPDNLLVYFHRARLLVVKVSDFGLALSIESMKTKVVCTAWYRPPEVFERVDSYTEKVDIWSMGCIYAELLSGLPLFFSESDVAILTAIRKMFLSPSHQHCTESVSGSSFGGADAARSEVALACNADPKVVRGVDRTHPLARILATHACESQMDITFRLLRIAPGERPSAERCVAMFQELVGKSIEDGRTERSEVARPIVSGNNCKNDADCARLFNCSEPSPSAAPQHPMGANWGQRT